MAFINSLFLPLVVLAGRNKGLSSQQTILPVVAAMMMPSPAVGLALALGLEQNQQPPALPPPPPKPPPVTGSGTGTTGSGTVGSSAVAAGSATSGATPAQISAPRINWAPNLHGHDRAQMEELAAHHGFTLNHEGEGGKFESQRPGAGEKFGKERIIFVKYKP